jgi:ubiquitin carboxyl-terminal hydrolase 34
MFHLKRFDFDLVEMRRSKINDLFEFPTVIDMSDYKIDHLSDPSQPRQEDIFELVGVLIHQGTSENGHYYSYIRERPSPPERMIKWLEFNDRDVDGFEPTSLPAWSFGGFFADTYPQQHKNFSAYMLFYQRQSAILKDCDDYMGSPSSGVAKAPVPAPLDQAIREDNEGFIREYSLYDPCHTKFARQLLANLRTINHGTCSEDHHQESQVISFVLEYLCQTLFRMKNDDLFEEIFSQLRRSMLSCPLCCQIMLKWLATQEYALNNTILLCLHQKVRSSMRAILVDGLKFLREKDPVAYGIDSIDTDGETRTSAPHAGVLVDVIYRLQGVMEESYFSTRGWDDLYLTLCQLIDMGPVETSVLLSHRCLEFCLRMFCLHASHGTRLHYPEMWRILEKRKRIYNRMIEFVYMLVSKMDINLPHVQNTRLDRLERYDQQASKFALSREEKNALNLWHDENRALAALDKMLELFDPDKTEVFYPGEILRWMLQSKDARFLSLLHTTVAEGINQLSPPVSDPYVRAALPCCEASTDLTSINRIIDEVAKAAPKLKSHGGQPTLGFFRGLLHAENDVVLEHRSVDAFYEYCLHHARKYLIPLLAYDDDGVRRATAAFVQELYTQYKDDTLLSEHSLKLKYKSIRFLAGDMCNRITDEHELNTSRSCMEPMISVCTLFVQLYEQLQESEDPTMEALRHADDAMRIQRWKMELAAAQQHWTFDEDTPVSTGEGYDHSDYGSESDVGDDILPDV